MAITTEVVGDDLRIPFGGGELSVRPSTEFEPPNCFKLTIRRYRGNTDESVFMPASAFHAIAEFVDYFKEA